MYFGDHPVKTGSKWGVHLEGQWRRHNVVTSWQQLFLRTGVNYQISPNLSVTSGYAFANLSRYGEVPAVAAASREHRLFEQALLRQNVGKWTITHRYRLEQRYLAE